MRIELFNEKIFLWIWRTESMTTVYNATFIKKDGNERNMSFVKLNDLPRAFLDDKIKGARKNNLVEGQEVVWDVEKSAFRIFNWSTLVGEPTLVETKIGV